MSSFAKIPVRSVRTRETETDEVTVDRLKRAVQKAAATDKDDKGPCTALSLRFYPAVYTFTEPQPGFRVTSVHPAKAVPVFGQKYTAVETKRWKQRPCLMLGCTEVREKGYRKVVATERIPANTVCVSERPLFTFFNCTDQREEMDAFFTFTNYLVSKQLDVKFSDQLNRLQTNSQSEEEMAGCVVDMENAGYAKHVATRFTKLVYRLHANAFQKSRGLITLVTPTCSAINHSCAANARWDYSLTSNFVTVRTTRDVEKGEEIALDYVENTLDPLDLSPAERKGWIRIYLGFECTCEICKDIVDF
jgi:hypothetical protein